MNLLPGSVVRWISRCTRITVKELPSILSWTARSLVYAFACLVATGELGPVSGPVTQSLLFLFLVTLVLLETPRFDRLFRFRSLVLAGAFLVVLQAPPAWRPLAPALTALGISPGRDDATTAWRLLGLTGYLGLEKVYLLTPAGWYAGEGIAAVLCSVFAPLSSSPLDWGPTALGLPGVVLIACFLLAGQYLLRRQADGPLIHWLPFAALAALYIVVTSVRLITPAAALPTAATAWQANFAAFLVLCLPLASLRRLGGASTADRSPANERESTAIPPSRWSEIALHARRSLSRLVPSAWVERLPFASILMALALGAILAASSQQAGSYLTSGKVVIFKDGAIPWGMPAPAEEAGTLSDGRVGAITRYLNAIGFLTAWHEGSITREALRDADVLLTMNLSRFLDEAETTALWDFVRNGGSLIVCGDHTDYSGLSVAYGRLLERVGIQFNFDSAVPVAGAENWRGALEFRPSPIAPEDWIPIELSISVGASLRIHPPAAPVIVGRYGFSDPGDRTRLALGSLGNLQLDRGERFGDVVLAAAARYGRGKVLVFGDTSSFMNYSLPATHRYLGSIFMWLANRDVPATNSIAPLFLLAALLCVAAFSSRVPIEHAAVGLLAAATFLPVVRRSDPPVPTSPRIAVIDASHVPSLSSPKGPDASLAGLHRALLRRGYLPLLMTRWDERLVGTARLVILPGPMEDYSPAEIRSLGEMSRRGAHLMVCTGWETAWLTPNLMRFLDVTVDSTPLGSADGKRVSGVKFDVPIRFVSAWPVSGSGYRTIYEAWGLPVVIGGYRQNGRIVVIGDARFLLGENLEGDQTLYEGNLWLFNTLAEW